MRACDTLARTLWGEARGEGLDGMAAVASVIMNRVSIGGWWGSSVVQVCRKPWQFSCWNYDNPNLAKLKAVTDTNPEFSDALMLAHDAVAGRLRDRTNGATHYYAPKVVPKPAWAKDKEPVAKIGDQLFYKLKG